MRILFAIAIVLASAAPANAGDETEGAKALLAEQAWSPTPADRGAHHVDAPCHRAGRPRRGELAGDGGQPVVEPRRRPAPHRVEVKGGWGDAANAVPGAVADADREALLTSTRELAARLAVDLATGVVGTEEQNRAYGAAKAKKLLKRWAKWRFEVVGGVRWIEGDGWAYAATLAIPYRVLALFRSSADGGWELVSIHYSTPI